MAVKKRSHSAALRETSAGTWFLAILGVLVVAGGVFTLRMGRLHYQNYRGDNVFSPFAVVVGTLAIVACVRNLLLGKSKRR